jgi:DHA1 family bicyclomycin/chloramphenicol resistance-like MFS transporter
VTAERNRGLGALFGKVQTVARVSPIPARTIALLGALSAFGPLSMDFYLPGLPRVADDLGTSASAVQLTLTACLLGLALGQVLAGPVSDSLGRRRPLLAGLVIFALASLGCAAAPNAGVLIGCRLIQGLAGAAGIVIARAVVRDRVDGSAASRTFAALLIVNSVVPVIAPLIGSAVLAFGTWRTVFAILAVIGAALTAWAALALPESLAVERRHSGGIRATGRTFARLLADRAFVGCLTTLALSYAALFLYLAGSPFVLQGIYGVSAQVYGLLFALNAVGLISAGQVSRRLADQVGPERLLRAGLALSVVGGAGLLAAVLSDAGLLGVVPALFCIVSAIGLTAPNATALALADHADAAGSASALLGVAQFGLGAAVAPLPGIAGEGTALPLALCSLVATLSAACAFARLVRPRLRVAAAV